MDRIGRYKIVRELGRGAMGVVYHAIDPNIGRPVAIKTIQLGGGRKPEEQDRLRERLFREARSAGILSHPGIVTIYDVEQQGDLAYIAMEFVDGPTLDEVLSSSEPLPPARMFSILGQAAAALDYAHQKGIVHRDIKPANIMIAADGTAKITDFGIAKVTASEQFTMTGAIVGTPHYMSPEQVQGQAVDGRSDQFSLAVIAFEMLTGEKPFTGEHLTTVVYKIVAEEPLSPTRINNSLGGIIEGAIRKALAKKPDGRYKSCQEFIDALEKACAVSKGWKTMPRGASLTEPTMAGVPARPANAVNMPPARRRLEGASTADREPRKHGFLTFLLAILLAAGLLALIGWQAAPWLLNNPAQQTAKNAPPAQKTAPPPAPTPPPLEQPKPVEPAGDSKPSPMPPADPVRPPETKPPDESATTATATTVAKTPGSKNAATQPVTIITSPGGATATLDGQSDTSCTTPCSINATTGRHTVRLALQGYQSESRDVDVGSGPLEMAPVVLRTHGGTLMLTTIPSGASVSINGKRIAQVTPAQIPLAAGSYEVMVEKDGRQNRQTVEIRGGMSYLKIILGEPQ